MTEDKQYTDEEIRAMAVKFFNEKIAPMFLPNIICQSCGSENCPCNETCHACNCQL